MCVNRYNSPAQDIHIVINPIKCAYSADCYLNGNCFIFSSGAFRAESLIHEFLHHVIHPVVVAQKDIILAGNAVYPSVDNSYCLSGNKKGRLDAFEEYAVREVTSEITTMNFHNIIFSRI